MPTTTEYLTDLVNQKNLLAGNLNQMGVTASEAEKLNTLVPKVLEIEQNKNCICGEWTPAEDTSEFELNNLPFKPDYVTVNNLTLFYNVDLSIESLSFDGTNYGENNALAVGFIAATKVVNGAYRTTNIVYNSLMFEVSDGHFKYINSSDPNNLAFKAGYTYFWTAAIKQAG